MRSSLSGSVVLVALAATSAAFYGCSSSDSGGGTPFGASGAAGTPVGAAGSNAAAGSVGVSGGVGVSGSAGAATGTAGAGGASTTGTGGASTAGAGGASTAGAGGASTGGGTGTSGASGIGDITKVVPTAGCGIAPPAGVTAGQTSGKQTIMTMGTKTNPGCADSNCAPWQYTREYYITLPAGYDKSKAYPLVLEGPGCGGQGTDVYPLTATTGPNVNNTVIRVGLTPPPNAIGHATNPGDGCFDDKEGDDSVDWTFYEDLYDKLSGQLCFDRNRVFSVGNSSGSWFSNELGCKYAGDAKRPVRGVLPNTGGLPPTPNYEPTCTTKPMAGMWVHEINDMTNPFSGNKFAIARAMNVNGCTIGSSYDDATLVNFPIGGGKPDDTCKLISGCPANYPLVVCALPGTAHASHDDVVNPGFSTFLTLFEKAPLLTP